MTDTRKKSLLKQLYERMILSRDKKDWVYILFGLFGGLIIGLGYGAYAGQVSGLLGGFLGGLLIGLIAGLAFGLDYGGLAVIQHTILRWMLYRSGDAPLNYAEFLQYTSARHLTRQVGGGFIFRHRMLMELFADSDW